MNAWIYLYAYFYAEFLAFSHYGVNQNNTYTNLSSNKENGSYKIIQKFYSFDAENEK